MKKCSACGYVMDDFDPICPRCQGKGLSPEQQKIALAAQKAAALPRKPVSPAETGQDLINGSTGALLFIVPGLFVVAFFAFLNDAVRSPRAEFKDIMINILMFAPLFLAVGAVLGAWTGSGLPRPALKLGALASAAFFFGLSFLTPFLPRNYANMQPSLLWFVFLLTVACGAVGSVGRHRNGENTNDSLLVKQAAVGVLCFLAPLIGLFVSISLGKNGSDYAAPALYGSLAGFIVIGLPFLLIVLGQ